MWKKVDIACKLYSCHKSILPVSDIAVVIDYMYISVSHVA